MYNVHVQNVCTLHVSILYKEVSQQSCQIYIIPTFTCTYTCSYKNVDNLIVLRTRTAKEHLSFYISCNESPVDCMCDATLLQVWKSVENGHWLDEEPYEMAVHFPSARLYRKERQAAGLLFRPHLFSSAGSVFVSSSCSNPPSQQLERLLTLTGGKVRHF